MKKLCELCGVNVARSKGKNVKGDTKFSNICSPCHDKPWIRFRKKKCENCGFIPSHICQLDVDHIDGDKSNNSEENLKTLCANCHRLKTQIGKDFLNKH